MTGRPLNPERLEAARRLRREMSMPERILWKRLRDRRLRGLKFRRQHPIGPYVADFYCAEAMLVVESDSEYHKDRLDADARRDEWMVAEGYLVLRTSASAVSSNLEGVLERIWTVAQRRIQELRGLPPSSPS